MGSLPPLFDLRIPTASIPFSLGGDENRDAVKQEATPLVRLRGVASGRS